MLVSNEFFYFFFDHGKTFCTTSAVLHRDGEPEKLCYCSTSTS